MRRSIRFSEHLKASTEGLVEEIGVDAAIDDSSVEEELMAAQDSVEGMSETQDELDSLEEATVQLEALMNDVAGEPDGLSPEAAKYVGHAVDFITAGWGLEQSIVPSMESFGGTLSREEATVSLEANVKDLLKAATDYMRKAWANISDFVKKVMDRLFSAAVRLKFRARSVKKNADDLTGSPNKDEIDITRLATKVAVNGKTPTNFAAAVGDYKTQIDSLYKAEEAISKYGLGLSISKFLSIKSDEEFNQVFESTKKMIEENADGIKKGLNLISENAKIPGGKNLDVSENEKGKIKISVSSTEQTMGTVSIKPLAPSEIKALAKAVEDFATEADAKIKSFKNFKKDAPAILKEDLSKADLTEAQAKKVTGLYRESFALLSKADHVVTVLLNQHVNAASAALAIASQSAKQYKGAKEDKKAEKEAKA